MYKIYFIIINLLLFNGCVTQTPSPLFEYSNQRFLERVISNINISEELDGIISTKYRISVHSIEPNESVSEPIISIIEDHLIASLIDNGFTLFERDNDVTDKLIKEGVEKLTLPPLHTINKIHSETPDSENKINNTDQIETHLYSSEISIFYRLLEAAIIFQDHPNERGYNKRQGIVRIHIRIHNTQTGGILHTAYLTGKLTDSIPKNINNQMDEFNYTLLPLIEENTE